ncbi:thr operon leader peptide [Edwardsiella tarda]|uniref:thr operon leader peptide n=2 Tax=Edwardsiella tarda TaxID=636 RepID=A0A2A7U6N4_EDWTA|nr:thr operon leader peptide [Edwardsiella tarda]UCQ01881.1 thr operon leader peptide [Edwardsiella tarda ATCC 15947 = NBRC 105688]PEH74066.1 thr operon leader peptide [Edwardsiella tarda]UAL57955.1 thr operon leader peptide [Edwardsiella tarda]UBU95297.1 thr operon leader peptide [Edwardsiella tarda]
MRNFSLNIITTITTTGTTSNGAG